MPSHNLDVLCHRSSDGSGGMMMWDTVQTLVVLGIIIMVIHFYGEGITSARNKRFQAKQAKRKSSS